MEQTLVLAFLGVLGGMEAVDLVAKRLLALVLELGLLEGLLLELLELWQPMECTIGTISTG